MGLGYCVFTSMIYLFIFRACEEGQREIVRLLLENGADGRIHPVTKYSPLYIACYYGRKDIVEILLRVSECRKIMTDNNKF